MLYFFLVINMFDGLFLSKIKNEILFLETGRINKINEIGETDFILDIRVNRNTFHLLISFQSEYSRIHLTEKTYDNSKNPKSFTMFLRKYIEGYFIKKIWQYQNDRIIIFDLEGYSELEDLSKKHLIMETMGRYSNLILTNDEYKILDSLKHDGVGEYNRTILPNAKYVFPSDDKINPFNLDYEDLKIIFINKNIKSPTLLSKTFQGISYTIAESCFNNEDYAKEFYNNLNKELIPSTFLNKRGKLDFYYNNLDNEIINKYDNLSKLLDEYYYEADRLSKIKEKTNDILSFITRELKKDERKLIKLNQELKNTDEKDKYKLYGELLLSYPNLKEKKKNVTVLNYYNNEKINIELDEKINIICNSNKYYKKYEKEKKSISFINIEIEKTNNEIEYFNQIKEMLSYASLNDALEIKDELINNKYLFENNNKNKKKLKPNYLTYEFNGIRISVGKNNIQNDYLTNHFAKKNEWWFHVKDNTGSHVIVHTDNDLDEDLIRCAANLSAYYSSSRLSSSVKVDYTKIKYIRKIPGRKGSFVTYKNERSIFIDPNLDEINKLKVIK